MSETIITGEATVKTNITPRMTKLEKLKRAQMKLLFRPGKAVSNYNIVKKLQRQIDEMEKRGIQ